LLVLKKRFIGVVTIKDGWAVQSIGYRRYLPLGTPERLVENLDRWGADEILVRSIDRSVAGVGPDYELLKRLASLGLATPLVFGGGIKSLEDGTKVIKSGADRIIVDSLLHGDLSVVKAMSEHLGAQAIIASIPAQVGASGLEWYDYRSSSVGTVSKALTEIIHQGFISEVMLTDWQHEGIALGFENTLIDLFGNKGVPLIAFGGISSVDQMRDLLLKPCVTAVAIGNFLNFREHAIQQFKEALTSSALRPPIYSAEGEA
jgi:cyclase